LRDAGFVRDRKQGTQCFYSLAEDVLPDAARVVLDGASKSDPILAGDERRLHELEAERRGGLPDSAADDLERYYSPGRSWQSLAAGLAGLLDLGDVLDVGSGDGAAAAALAPYSKSLTCIDVSERLVETARTRLGKLANVRVQLADAHALPFADDAFDAVLLFHTLTHAVDPAKVLREGARVLRRGGRLSLLCLDRHQQQEITARYGELHAGFSPAELKSLLSSAGLDVRAAHVASRETRKPHLQVVLAVAHKPTPSAS
jgi:ArsR family transcriptional regulator